MTLRRSSEQGWIVAGAVALAGCGGAASTEVESDSAPTTVEGVIHVERSAVSLGASDATTTRVSAKFLRVLPEDATRAQSLVGSRVVVPTEGECAPIANLTVAPVDLLRLRRAGLKGPVELVDVGDLDLRASAPGGATAAHAIEMQLTPRAFPDVGDLVSGVFYTQPDVASSSVADLPSPGSYVLSGTGASVVAPFALDAEAPAMPANVKVAGQALSGGKSLPTLSTGRELTLEWAPPSAADGTPVADASVYVDVQGAQPYRCAFKDSGSATLPVDVISRDDAGHAVTISVHRAREENLHLDLVGRDGNESAVVRFDFSRSGRFLVE